MASDNLARVKLARAAALLGAGSGLPPLVLMTDDERLADPLAAAAVLPRGSLIVVRARQTAHRAKLARSLFAIARRRRLYLSVANDPALARRIGAHGLHLSEARAGEAAHWRALRPGWLLTASAHSLAAVRRARGAHAVFVSPIFATQSHAERVPLGPLRLRAFSAAATVPLYALGGVDGFSVRRLKGARLAGIAAIGALAAH